MALMSGFEEDSADENILETKRSVVLPHTRDDEEFPIKSAVC